MTDRYLDDFKPGEKFTSGKKTLSAAEIIEFAKLYDPQPFHLDEEAGKRSIYGALIASGFQTLAMGFRLIYDTGIFTASSLGSPGFDELRWLNPVRAGDTLHVELEVGEVRPSKSKPDRGILFGKYRYINQNGDVVLTYAVMHMLRRRPI